MSQIFSLELLKTDYWRKLVKSDNRKPEFDHDEEADVLYIYFTPIDSKDRIITHYIDKYVAVLFRHSDKEVVGMSIESFIKGFVPSYEDKAWMLSNTGVKIAGIRDFIFKIESRKVELPKPRIRVREPFEPRVKAEPVFA